MTIVDEIYQLFEGRGDDAYFGEAITQTEHGLQAAHLARQEGASDSLIVAALLHDIGHLLPDQTEELAEQGVDGRHEEAGEAWLSRYFASEVTEPIRLHVAAKRYLCAVQAGYLEQLSPASVLSLKLQGGPFTPEQVREFEANPHFQAAARLRHWDDEAKVPDLVVPDLESYRSLIESVTINKGVRR